MTNDRFDNFYINKRFHAIDMKRLQLHKETVLPLKRKETQKYIEVSIQKLKNNIFKFFYFTVILMEFDAC